MDIYLGKVEKAVLADLALHPNSLVKPIKKRVKKDCSNVHEAVGTLKKKGLVKEAGEVKSEKGGKYVGYHLMSDGILHLAADDTFNLNRIHDDYKDESFIVEYHKVLSALPKGENLVNSLVHKAAKLALDQDDRKARALEIVGNLAKKVEAAFEGNRRFRRAYKLMRREIAELREKEGVMP